jgi:hippurate hydrolase
VAAILSGQFGDSNVTEMPSIMGSEDFSVYGRAGVPAVMFSIGAVEPQKFEKAKASGATLPGPHSPEFAPDP